jgi:hypothetical protein
MSVSLVVLLPIAMLGIVSVFCFVGCDAGGLGGGFGGGIPPPFTQYSDLTVLGNPTIVAAYWPLGEMVDTDAAVDRGPNSPNKELFGKYVDQNTVATVYPPPTPSIYPWPLSPPLPNPPKIDVQSAAAPGAFALGQAGLVMGDAKQPGNDLAVLTTCMVVNGCYVQVPFKAKWNPASFTLEAWVRVDWQSGDTQAWRAVLDGRAQTPVFQGFSIIATLDEDKSGYHWSVILGNGGTGSAGFSTLTDDVGPQITLLNPTPLPETPPSTPVYLAATYDATSKTLTLFVDGKLRKSMTSPTSLYQPNTSSPLYIGAGAPYAPLRQVGGGSPTDGPLFPFVGAIQDVAIYNVALSATDIQSHFNNGIGILT